MENLRKIVRLSRRYISIKFRDNALEFDDHELKKKVLKRLHVLLSIYLDDYYEDEPLIDD